MSALCVLASCAPDEEDDDCIHVSGDLAGADVERCASRVETVEGTLWVDEASGELEFPKLVEVGGKVSALEDGPSKLLLPRLERIGGALNLSADRLESVALPVLESAAELSIYPCPMLRSVSLPALRELNRGLEVHDPQFEELSLPALERVGTTELGTVEVDRISFDQPPKLRRLLLPKLQRADIVTIQDNGALESVDLGSLTSVRVTLTLMGHLISESDSLEEFELPALQQAGLLWFQSTYNLKRVSLPALREVSSLWFTYNDALSEVEVPASASVSNVDARDNPSWCGLDELLETLEVECSNCEAEPATCAK